jgi:putative membrane protein
VKRELGPRIEVVDAAAPRLEPGLPEALPLVPAGGEQGSGAGARTGRLLLAGSLVLLLGTVALGLAGFALDQFARAAWLGWATVGVGVAGFGLVGAGLWRELRALFALRAVDATRAAMASGDAGRIMAASREWAGQLPQGEELLPALRAVNDPDAALALLRAGPCAALRARAAQLGARAAVQVAAGVAAVPSPSLDALLVAWRGVRLVRQVAALYGVRPGMLGTLSLLRRTALSATLVAGTEAAANVAMQAVLGNPLLAHVLGDAAAAGVAARRMVVLARAAAAACDPVPPE